MSQEDRCTPMITGFSIRSNVPVDDRFVFDTTPDVTMLPTFRRYEGMVVYVKDEKTLKVLQNDLLTWDNIGMDDGVANTITEDITVAGIGDTFGGVVDQQVIPSGTTLNDLAKLLLQKSIPAVYKQPNVKLTLNPPAGNVEVGTVLTPQLSYTFTKNDAGDELSHTFAPDDNEVQSQVTIVEGDNPEYSVEVSFDEGPQKMDNFGKPSGTPIAAGTVKATAKYVGVRHMFYGADAGTAAPVDSSEVRSLTGKEVANVTIVVPAGSQRVVIGLPQGKTVKSVKYVEQGNAEYLSKFVTSTVSVDGATVGADAKDYTVYTYVFAIPCGSNMTFNVTIA